MFEQGSVDVKFRWDQDGVLVDFAGEVERKLGFHPDGELADKHGMWNWISAHPEFWRELPVLGGAHEMWSFAQGYDNSILTGVGGDHAACRQGKRASALMHFGCSKVVVTGWGRKPEFARPGDILVDDREDNIAAWQAAGGFGIVHRDAAVTIEQLKEIGVLGGGRFSPEFLQEVERRRTSKEFRRDGYTGYVIDPESARKLVQRFGVREGMAESYRLVCAHITRSFPARMDTVDNAQPLVEVVGEFFNPDTGHHVLAVEVAGQILREDRRFYHITYALDNNPASVAARQAQGLRAPNAGASNNILVEIAQAQGISALYNLEQRIAVQVDFALLDQAKMAALPRPKPVFIEEVSQEQVEFLVGASITDDRGNQHLINSGVMIARTRGDNTAYTWGVQFAGKLVPHREDGPAVERKSKRSGEILYQAWFLNGKQITREEWENKLCLPKPFTS